MRNFDSYEKSNLYDTNPYSTMDDLKIIIVVNQQVILKT